MSQSTGLVGFTYTSPNLRVPLVTFEVQSAGLATNQTQRVLLIGSPNGSFGLAPIQMFGATYAAGLFGPGSMLARMVAKYVLNDGIGEVWALPTPPAPASAPAIEAKFTLTIVGTAAGSATTSIYIGDQAVQVSITSGMTPAQIAAAVVAALGATPTLPISGATAAASGSAETVTFSPAGFGLQGDFLPVGINLQGIANGESLPSGVSIAVSSTAGSGVPSWPDLRPVLGNKTFDLIVCGFTDQGTLNAVSQALSDSAGRWSPTSQLYGHSLGCLANTAPNLVLAGGQYNDQHTTLFGVTGSPTPPWEIAAAIAGAVFPSLKADPGRPLQTLPVLGVMAPPISAQPTISTKQTLLTSGIAMLAFDDAGNCTVLRAVTTYTTNAYGVQDINYLDTETLFEIVLFNRTLLAAYALKFGRVKLADNGTHFGAGVAIVTPNDIRNEIIAQYVAMEANGLVEDTADFTAGLIVQRNSNDPSRVDVLLDPTFVSGLRLIANLVKFSLLPPTIAATS